jgi:hypothetical protein
MTKEEFKRKLFGHTQTVKNNRIKVIRSEGREADDFTYTNIHHIQSAKRKMRGK